MNFRQKRRIVAFIALFIGVCCIWISAQSEKIQCIPNLDNDSIVIQSKNICISNVTTKFGNLVLSSMDCKSCLLSIVEYGTEYVRVDYIGAREQRKFTVFEIVLSPNNLVTVSQFDEAGNQINYSAY